MASAAALQLQTHAHGLGSLPRNRSIYLRLLALPICPPLACAIATAGEWVCPFATQRALIGDIILRLAWLCDWAAQLPQLVGALSIAISI